jgi:trigger factor
MAIAVETLEKLQRRMTITLPLADVQAEVEKRLKMRARTVKAPGFRPGKVPMKMVAAQLGPQIENEVLNDKVSRAFSDAANENKLKVAGFPRIEPKSGAAEGSLVFDATFEVYPEVKIGDLSQAEVEKTVVQISDAEVDKTIDILRQQRMHFHVKGEQGEHGDGGSDASAQKGDRVTVDFVGTIDGVEFQGGKASDYAFVLGEGRMLPEFEAAATGLKTGESKTFPLSFPADYHGKDVAGKTAEFKITMKKVEWPHMPAIDAEFAKSLGIADGDVAKMREEIRANLDREVNGRAKAKSKTSVMDALLQYSELDVPKILVVQEAQRLLENTRNDMAQRGMDVKNMPFPQDMFNSEAERRVKLGLIIGALVEEQKLQPTPDQVKKQVEEFAQSYEDPKQFVKYYYSDRNRLAEIEALVLEENVVNYVLGKAKVTEKAVGFDELMGNAARA